MRGATRKVFFRLMKHWVNGYRVGWMWVQVLLFRDRCRRMTGVWLGRSPTFCGTQWNETVHQIESGGSTAEKSEARHVRCRSYIMPECLRLWGVSLFAIVAINLQSTVSCLT